jgi:hypothetical protein
MLVLLTIGIGVCSLLQGYVGNDIAGNILLAFMWLPLIAGSAIDYYFKCKSEYDSKK